MFAKAYLNLVGENVQIREIVKFIIVSFLIVGISGYAKGSEEDLQISYENRLVSISATNVDLKKLLIKLAEETNILLWYPKYIDKSVSIEINDISLNDTLKRILIGYDYVVIHSGVNKELSKISEVIIVKPHRNSLRTNKNNRRIERQIRAYRRRIDSFKKYLSTTEPKTSVRNNYKRQIQNLEKKIKRLERRLN